MKAVGTCPDCAKGRAHVEGRETKAAEIVRSGCCRVISKYTIFKSTVYYVDRLKIIGYAKKHHKKGEKNQ